MSGFWVKGAWLVCLSLILVTVSFTGCVDEDADLEVDKAAIRAAAELAAIALRTTFNTDLLGVQGLVQTMASTDELEAVLATPNATNNQSANDYLAAYNEAHGTAVCYLMNVSGITVAASNWNTSSSFVGKDYSFRPYFTSGLSGGPGEYFAVGVTTGVRGYYASFPIMDNSTVIGVAIIKQELDYLEADLAQLAYAFLISPEGVIFMSSDSDLVLMSLWPLGTTVEDTLATSKQFGAEPFEPLFDSVISDGDEVTYNGKQFLFTMKRLNTQGWNILMLSPV